MHVLYGLFIRRQLKKANFLFKRLTFITLKDNKRSLKI